MIDYNAFKIAIREECLKALADGNYDDFNNILHVAPAGIARNFIESVHLFYIGESGPWADQSGWSDAALRDAGIEIPQDAIDLAEEIYLELKGISPLQAAVKLISKSDEVTFTPAK